LRAATQATHRAIGLQKAAKMWKAQVQAAKLKAKELTVKASKELYMKQVAKTPAGFPVLPPLKHHRNATVMKRKAELVGPILQETLLIKKDNSKSTGTKSAKKTSAKGKIDEMEPSSKAMFIPNDWKIPTVPAAAGNKQAFAHEIKSKAKKKFLQEERAFAEIGHKRRATPSVVAAAKAPATKEVAKKSRTKQSKLIAGKTVTKTKIRTKNSTKKVAKITSTKKATKKKLSSKSSTKQAAEIIAGKTVTKTKKRTKNSTKKAAAKTPAVLPMAPPPVKKTSAPLPVPPLIHGKAAVMKRKAEHAKKQVVQAIKKLEAVKAKAETKIAAKQHKQDLKTASASCAVCVASERTTKECSVSCACSSGGLLTPYGKYSGKSYTGCPGEVPCDPVDSVAQMHDWCCGVKGILSCECAHQLYMTSKAAGKYLEAHPKDGLCPLAGKAASEVVFESGMQWGACKVAAKACKFFWLHRLFKVSCGKTHDALPTLLDRFHALDTDADGEISLLEAHTQLRHAHSDEGDAELGPFKNFAGWHRRFDEDRSGGLSLEEYAKTWGA